MRPIHAVLLVLFLAAVLVGALILVQTDSNSGHIAPPIADNGSKDSDPARDTTSLDPAGGAFTPAGGSVRATVETGGNATIITGPVAIRGRVVDDGGRGIAGATVYASPAGGPLGFALDEFEASQPWFRRKETTTDAAGRFQLEPEAPGAVRLAVRADGFAPFDAERPIAGAGADVGDLVLERGVVLQGRVVDTTGRGVPNAELHLARDPNASFVISFSNNAGPVVAKTDAAGAFRIDRLAVGPWSLVVTSLDHPDKTESGATERAGQVVANLLFTLEAGASIDGQVVGLPAGAAQDLTVFATESGSGTVMFGNGKGQRRAAVEADGRFRVGGCKQDTGYSLVLRRAGAGIPVAAHSETVAAQSGDHNVVIQYRSETAITCRVVALDTGAPIETLNVSAGYRWPMPLMTPESKGPQKHFEGGRVRFAPLTGGTTAEPAQIRIESPGFTTFERKDLRLIAGIDNDIGVIQLARSALVKVTVLDAATGAPVQNASVSLNEVSRNGSEIGMTFSFDSVSDGEPEFLGPGAAHRGRTDKEGRVALTSMPAKSVTLSVTHKGHATWKSAAFDLPAVGDYEFTARISAGGTVVVEVADADKKPVAGLSIDHRDPILGGDLFMPGMASESITDAAGRVVFAHIPPGKHLFRVRANNAGSFLEEITIRAADDNRSAPDVEKGWSEIDVPEGETVTLHLLAPEMGSVRGRVREGGKPLAGANVRLKRASELPFGLDFELPGRPSGATTNAAGEYTLSGVTTGDYKIVVAHASRMMKFESDTTVRTGENRLDIDLTVAIIEGRITDEAGKPIEGVKVSVERARKQGAGAMEAAVEMSFAMVTDAGEGGESVVFGNGGNAPSVKTDAEGRYRLRGVTPDMGLQVVASARDYQTERSERVELAADQVRSGLDLVLKQGGSIEVSVRRRDGGAVLGAILNAEQIEGEGAPKTLFTGPGGKSTFQGLATGRWRVTCRKSGFDPESRDGEATPQEVEVRSGKVAKITFDLDG
ncbi:MAG: carboxypeptidase regulatory-like domain-containing protein [Planctomycetes bacterium]|nr:carboxypeptidase regulatory-like domain-containing protein [Planctomycetota bacterium]